MNKISIWCTVNGVEDRSLVVSGTKLSDVLADRGIGCGTVEARVNDVIRDGTYELREGDRISVSTKKYNSGCVA